MATKRYLSQAKDIQSLTEFLSKCSEVKNLDKGAYNEAGTLAHTFADLEESFREFLDNQLPKLINRKIKESDINDLLLEIGEEFRHILYHVGDPKFYCYLHPGKEEEK